MSASADKRAQAGGVGPNGSRRTDSQAPTPTAGAKDFASGARILSIGIASTGIFTFAYLALASNLLTPADYSRVSISWAIMYVILCVIYRPVEQLLSRTIAERRARGDSGHVLRTPAIIQASFALLFLIVALILHHAIVKHLFQGSEELFWILVVGVLAYAGSYFARGWLAGNKRFALYGGLVFLESTSRFVFAIAAALAVGSHLGSVGLGMAVAPFVSLTVIPFAFRRVTGPASVLSQQPEASDVELVDAALEGVATEGIEEAATDLSLRHGGGFAAAVVAIMASEQTLMNAGVLIVALGGGGNITDGLAGFVFNVLLIVRAPLQLFQALQTSILPHLTSMEVEGSVAEFRKAIRLTVTVIGAFAGVVAVGLLAIGPFVMSHVLHSHTAGAQVFHYNRFGLACVGVGMGLHLVSGTLNQALLARGRARIAAVSWLSSAVIFVLFVALRVLGPGQADKVWSVEAGYLIATGVLATLLWIAYQRSSTAHADLGPDSAAAVRLPGAARGSVSTAR